MLEELSSQMLDVVDVVGVEPANGHVAAGDIGGERLAEAGELGARRVVDQAGHCSRGHDFHFHPQPL